MAVGLLRPIIKIQNIPTDFTGIATVAASGSDGVILAANDARIGALIYNGGSTILYLRYNTTATATTTANYSEQVPVDGKVQVPFGYKGQVRGIWAGSPTGGAQTTEFVTL